jgi:hypothetical protein
LFRSILVSVIAVVDEISNEVVVVGADRSVQLVASQAGVRAVVNRGRRQGSRVGWTARVKSSIVTGGLIIMADLVRVHRDD